jgi:serine/threonine-protein kinase RsbW
MAPEDVPTASPVQRERRTSFRQATLRTTGDMDQAVEAVLLEMAASGYRESDSFALRLALEEAILNALKHGNRYDPAKHVRVRWLVSVERVLAEIEDQGDGFDPRQVPDPLSPQNVTKLSGRGLLLMHSYLSWMRYNERGNQVTLCKYPTSI